MTDWTRLARRVVLGALCLTAALMVIAMAVSYAGLRAAFLGAGFPVWSASAIPFCIDFLALVGYVALLVLRGKTYPSVVVAVTVLGSAALQGYHLSHGGVTAAIGDAQVVFLAGAVPMICAGLAGHLAWRILERALPAGFVAALRADAPVFDAPVSVEAERLKREQDARNEANRAAGWPAGPNDDLPPLLPPVRTVGEFLAGVPVRAERAWEEEGKLAERMLADYPSLHSVPATVPEPHAVRATVHRPRRTTREKAPSQATGPCVPECAHHRDMNVSKSTRYRCRDLTCPTCREARGA